MLRFSLKQLLALVTLSALAVVSLKYASWQWQATLEVLALVSAIAAVTAAIFCREDARAFAMGYATVIAICELLDMSAHSPTQHAFGSFHIAIARDGRHVVENIGNHAMMEYTEKLPPQLPFVRIGQLWLALVFSYCGGHFARFVYLRRIAEQSPAEKVD